MSMAYASVRLLFCGLASASLFNGHGETQSLLLSRMLPMERPACLEFDPAMTLEAPAERIMAEAADDSAVCEDTKVPRSRIIKRVCRVTAYHDRGITAAGVPSGVGQCAAPEDIPFGTRVYIPELDRWFIVTDRTHQRFRHNTVDLFIRSRTECINFGRRYLECRFELPEEKLRYGQLRLSTIRDMLRKTKRS